VMLPNDSETGLATAMLEDTAGPSGPPPFRLASAANV
jgi:hypothetical protein